MNPLSAAAWVAAFFLCANLFSHTVALRLLLLLAGLALCAWASLRKQDRPRLLPDIWVPFLLWAAWAALSIYWSVDAARSEKEFRNEIVYAGAGLWICFVAAQAANARRVILPVVACGVVLACGMALYYFSPQEGRYIGGWHGGPGDHSSALLTIAPCLLAFGLETRSRAGRIAFGALGVLILASAYTTLNRTVWLGFGLELAVVAFFLLGKHWQGMKARARVFSAAAVLMVAVGAVAMVAVVQSERAAVNAALPIKQDPRFKLWPEVIELIEARPLTGYGFGRGLMRQTLRTETGDVLLWHSHNLFLDAAVQTGLPGVSLLLVLLFSIARASWRASRESASSVTAAAALMAVLAGMIVRNMTDVLWIRQNALLFWGVVGVLLAWSYAREEAA